MIRPWVQSRLVCQKKSCSVRDPNTTVESNGITGPHGLFGPLLCVGQANDKRSNAPQTPNHSMRALHDSTKGHPKQVRNGLHLAKVAVLMP